MSKNSLISSNLKHSNNIKHYFIIKTRGYGTTPLRVEEDIQDLSSELGNGGVNKNSITKEKVRRIENSLRYRESYNNLK
ncbi:UNVERIFIED_CONTAM: hypothetical protein NCL1_18321 [Trichonephila clavipes]